MGNEDFAFVKAHVKIEDYAEYLGMHVIPRGRILTTREHDSLIIRPDQGLYYRNSTQRGGTIIDFVMEFTEYDTPGKAVKHLMEFTGLTDRDREKIPHRTRPQDSVQKVDSNAQHLALPDRAGNSRRIYGYLNKTRGISAAVIGHMIKHGYLYQDTRNNCVFVGYDRDGKACFGMLRSTLSSGTFKGDLKGCDYDKGMLVSHEADTLVITEAAIDAMSYMDMLMRNGKNYRDYDYLILGSASKWKALEYRLETGQYSKIILALDNDDAGRIGNDRMTEMLEELNYPGETVTDVPVYKDWNEDLLEMNKAGEEMLARTQSVAHRDTQQHKSTM